MNKDDAHEISSTAAAGVKMVFEIFDFLFRLIIVLAVLTVGSCGVGSYFAYKYFTS